MIAPDSNLLIYAHDPVSPFHRESRKWLEDLFSSPEPVGIPILSIQSFLRFVTSPRLASTPITFTQGCALVNTWLALPDVSILYPGHRHWQILQQIGQQVRLQGNLLTDAAIAAIAKEHGAIIHTNDRDFARFPDVRWHNPLQP